MLGSSSEVVPSLTRRQRSPEVRKQPQKMTAPHRKHSQGVFTDTEDLEIIGAIYI